jgi:hypothetical protein
MVTNLSWSGNSIMSLVRLALKAQGGKGYIPFSEGITHFPDFALNNNSRCQVLGGSCKELPHTSVLLYFSGSSGSLISAC